MGRFGMKAADGTVAVEATECVLTGRPVDPENSVREMLTGTRYFFRVVKGQYDRVTDALRDEWRAEVTSTVSVSVVPSVTADVPVETSEKSRRQKSLES
jgi:hypothetical protein